jgi:hypothetical protein
MKTTAELETAIRILERTPMLLRAWLEPLPNEVLQTNEGEGTWSPQQIVGHFIFGEQTDWIPRIERILQHGELRPFDPFDRNGNIEESRAQRVNELLEQFTRLRKENLDKLRGYGFRDADLVRKGKHPALGAVTLGQLLAAWVAHDLTHIHQLSRVMAHPYREKVGPWVQYMGVMKCTGHG